MGITNFGLIKLGSYVRGLSPSFAGSMAFGNGTSTFDGTIYNLDKEFTRKPIVWSWDGTDPKGEVTFSESEANGSYFAELGLGSGNLVGSDLWTRDTSAIGSKLSTYEVEVYFTWRFRRFS